MGYTVETTLEDAEARRYVDHAERVLTNLENVTVLEGRVAPSPLAAGRLCLFRTQWQYWDYMERAGVGRDHSRGVFFVPPDGETTVIATYVEGQSATEVFSTLQHEGFHQYAFSRFGEHFPIWLNEGLAQYYQDALMIGGALRFGVIDARRLGLLQAAIRANVLPPLTELLKLSRQKWNALTASNPRTGSIQYAHAWGLTWYLLHARDGALRPVLAQVLEELGRPERRGKPSPFKIPDAMEKRFREYMLDQAEPDPLTTTLERMTFLSYGLLALDRHGIRQPRGLDELQRRLSILQFEVRLPRPDSPDPIRFLGSDASMYRYPTDDGLEVPFVFSPGENHRALGRVVADVADHRPTLTWFRSSKRVPVALIEFED